MASTIQIKNSTTSGNSPSSLATGELAINVVDGNFFYGSASAVKQDFALGNLTASNTSISGTLSIEGSGSTLFEVVGSEGQLFSITDNLSGSLFAVSDVSGLPILEVFSDDTVKIGTFNNEGIIVGGSNVTASGNVDIQGILSIPGFNDVSASLAAAVAGGDDLGNHTATQNLDMGGNAITNVGNVDGVDVSALNSTVSTNTSNIATLTAATSSYSTATGVENNADVTDATNVQAAGALMDSEVTSLSGIKTLTVPDNTTISTFGASLIDDTNAGFARSTLGLGTMATQASGDYVSINGDTLQGGLDLGTYNVTNVGELRATTVSGSTFVSDGVTVMSTPDVQTVKIGQSSGGSGPMRVSIVSSDTQYGLFGNDGIQLTGSVDISSTLSIPGFTDVSASLASLTSTNYVLSINGEIPDSEGDVLLTTSDISEGTNEYYTDTKVKTKLNADNVVSGSAANVKSFLNISSADISDVDAFSQTGTYASLRAQGTTAGDVGLGNVTNESKATMFTSPTFTGTTAAPTPSTADDSTKIATTAYVQANLDNLIGNAGAALDTLGELSASLADATGSIESLVTEIDGKLAKSSNLSDLTNTATARTNLGVDAAGTDNSTNVTLAGTPNYITISGQQITRNQIDLTTDVTGQLPAANLGTITSAKISDVDAFSQTGTYASLRAQGTTAGDVGLGNVENTALSTYTGNGGALDNQYITNGAGYTTNTGTVTSVGGTGTVSGLSLSGTVTTSGNLTLGGTISISSTNITDVDAFSQTGTYASLRAQGTTAGDVGLGNVTNESKATMFTSPTFTGTVAIPGFNDVSASLAAAVAGGDNLGNHTATQNLNMGTYAITNVGNVDGVDVSTLKSDFDTLEGKTLVSGSSQIDLGSATGTAANASTASYVAGSNVDGTVASATLAASAVSATSATTVAITNVSNDDEYGFVFRTGTGSPTALYGDSQVDTPSWNPSTNTIVAPTISASSALYVGGDITATGTITGNSIVGTLATAAQTNITSVGTLGSLTMGGDIDMDGNTITMNSGQVDGAAEISSNVFRMGNGGVTTPSLAFSNDTNTGIYSIAPDTMGLVAGGSSKINIGSTIGAFVPFTVTDNTDNTNTTLVTINNTNTGTPISTNQYSLKVNGGAAYGTPGGQNKSYGGYFTAGDTNATNPDSIALYAQGHEDGAPNSYAAIFSGSAGGVVGINTVEPTVELEVDGDGKFSGTLEIGGISDVSASIAAAGGGGATTYRVAIMSNGFYAQNTLRYLTYNTTTETTSNNYISIIPAAADGRVISVTCWPQASGGSSELAFYVNGGTASATDTQTLTLGVPVQFTFSSGNTFSALDELSFSIDPTNTPNGLSFQIILEYDY